MQSSKLTHILCIGLLLIAATSTTVQAADNPVTTRRIVISVALKQLTLFDGDTVLKNYDVAVGKPSTPSPIGSFEVVNRIDHPTWYGHGTPVTPGPRNPLGTRWIGLSKRGYGIHGTNEPVLIGQPVSHGCIRMRNEDVEELFALVEPGMTVELIDY